MEVISWWLGLGLLVLPLISSELAAWVHWVEIIVEEQLRVVRWASVEASTGLGEWVFEVLLLSCGSGELVYSGLCFRVGWQLAFPSL